MKNIFKYSALALAFLTATLGAAQKYEHKFQDPELSNAERAEDLISKLTLEEKVGQLMYGAPAIERLNIPQYNWWNECLHGVARNGRATVFPQAIGLGATFDTGLILRIGQAISMEARAKYNASVANNQRERYQGLTFWTPNVNIFRDPRWGRGQETYGEDPYLTSRIRVSFVKGLQGDHPKYLQAAGMAKHYAVHNGPERLRHEFDAVTSMKDLWETYLPAFEALVTEAHVEGVMGAYNRTNGFPCCAHPYLMQEVLRKKWGFKGYFVSDCWAIVDFYEGHKVVDTPAEAAAMALNAGTNLNCGSSKGNRIIGQQHFLPVRSLDTFHAHGSGHNRHSPGKRFQDSHTHATPRPHRHYHYGGLVQIWIEFWYIARNGNVIRVLVGRFHKIFGRILTNDREYGFRYLRTYQRQNFG